MANWCSNAVVIDCATEPDAEAVQRSLATTAEHEFLAFTCKRVGTILVSDFRSRWQPPFELFEDIAAHGHEVVAYACEQGSFALWQGQWRTVAASSDMPPIFWEIMSEAGLLSEVPFLSFERIVAEVSAVLDPYAEARSVAKLQFHIVPSHGGVYVAYERDTALGRTYFVNGPFDTEQAVAWGKKTIDRVAGCDWMLPIEKSYLRSVGVSQPPPLEELTTWCEHNCTSPFQFDEVESGIVAVTFDDEADRALFGLRWL